MTQNVTKNRIDFPVQEQLITNKTEAIMRGMIQDNKKAGGLMAQLKECYYTTIL